MSVAHELTDGWGADIVFECSGSERAAASRLRAARARRLPWSLSGCRLQPIAYDVVAAQLREARVEHVFRYAHVYPRALALMGSGKIDVKPLDYGYIRLCRQRPRL